MSMFERLLFGGRTPNTNAKCVIVTRGKEADKPERMTSHSGACIDLTNSQGRLAALWGFNHVTALLFKLTSHIL